MAVVIVACESWYADANGVLCAGNDAVVAFGMVFEAEYESCKHFGLHVWELYGPDALDDVACGCAESASLAYGESGL